jgi:prepilin-type processing-associated H-X9-DG protein
LTAKTPLAFNVAMMRFAVLFGDGHVAVDVSGEYLLDRWGGSVGLTLDQTDDGAVIVVSVIDGLPAAEAGIEPGAEVLRWSGASIEDALDRPNCFSARPARARCVKSSLPISRCCRSRRQYRFDTATPAEGRGRRLS